MGVSRVRDVEKEKKEKKEEKKKEKVKIKRAERRLREVVRIANTDLDGSKTVYYGLTGIKGISYTMSKAICIATGLEPTRKLNSLTEEEIAKIEDVIKDPLKYNIPSWVLNRRRDRETGEDLHLVGGDLEIKTKLDIQRMINLRTWKGVRHMYGLPVRGQKTRSRFRKGRTVGVIKKAELRAQAKEKK